MVCILSEVKKPQIVLFVVKNLCKNITGDIDTKVISLDDTLEPYKTHKTGKSTELCQMSLA